MKRVLSVLAVVLLLVATVISSISARQHPLIGPYARPSGEDHPWGGEQNYEPDSDRDLIGTTSGPEPGIIHFETYLVWKLVMPLWLEKYYGGTTTIITIDQPTTNPDVNTGEGDSGTTTVNSQGGM